ncbi:TRAP transporter substrate-binding protein [Enterovirga sp. CN4-39]|uniref:TRAP transporter substrate-binding protein n=1 Tax=Enterovirga sp. CN4-39 TaxID=3400910 RepID=UPI003C0C757A
MKRRDFVMAAAPAAATAMVASPAIATSMPSIKWRLVSSYPKSLDTLFGCSPQIAKRVAEATDNQFQLQVFAAGEIVPALQVMDAVQNGTVECGHTLSNFYIGKDPAFVFDSCVPFGLNARQQNAWLYQGGGLELIREFMSSYNIYSIPAGNTGAQMGGWFRKEIKTVDDLKGLKFRVAGLAGQILSRLGVVPQQLGGGDIYPALERGTLDAAEFSGPHDDEKLGFFKVAKYYYYPGWWEGGPNVSMFINMDKWNSLPAHYKAVLEAACAETVTWSLAKYDNQNPDALFRLLGAGAELRAFPQDVMAASFREAYALYNELADKSPNFAKMYQSWLPYWRKEQTWFRIAELPFDAFVSQQAQAKR